MNPTGRGPSSGFTLIEILIAIVVVAILAAIALPNYSDYVRRSKIIEATNKLADHRVRMEQFFADNRSYAGPDAKCGVADPPFASGRDAFKVECTGASATTYLVTANGKDSMSDFVYTINEANAKVTTGVPTGWTKNDGCWVLRKDGSCS